MSLFGFLKYKGESNLYEITIRGTKLITHKSKTLDTLCISTTAKVSEPQVPLKTNGVVKGMGRLCFFKKALGT